MPRPFARHEPPWLRRSPGRLESVGCPPTFCCAGRARGLRGRPTSASGGGHRSRLIPTVLRTTKPRAVHLTWADAAGVPWPGIIGAAAAKCREIGARLLVVDTLPQFAGLRGDAENNSGDALEAIGPLQLLAADGFAILVTRHDRKSGGEQLE